MTNPSTTLAAMTAAKKETKEVVKDTRRVFKGNFPQSVSLMTAEGIPVYFYGGYHVTEDRDVIEFLTTEKTVEEVTGKVDIEKVPTPPARNRNRNWASANRSSIDPTQFSPADLLQRAVANSSTLSTAAESNSK